ncbi:MAG: hypothetical protein NTV86_03895 [Planctomycetota bacterium]|nr:hypothetical protein [Planctomycetota bacterium]
MTVTTKRILVSAGILALAALATGAWAYLYLPGKNWGVVEPGRIYRSGLMQPWQVKRVLKDNNIRVIITMNGRDIEDPKQRAQEEAAAELGIEILRFPMGGDGREADGTMALHAKAVAAICKARQEGKPVLVQCAAGANRAGGVVATYELLVQRRDPSDVLAEMRKHKYSPERNPKLLEYLNHNMKEAAPELVAIGVIKEVPPVTTIGASAQGPVDGK